MSENSDLFEAVNKGIPITCITYIMYIHLQCVDTSGNVSKVKELLSEKPSLACIVDKDGATPLMFASNKGYKDVGVTIAIDKAGHLSECV